jgi:hypothetical protein
MVSHPVSGRSVAWPITSPHSGQVSCLLNGRIRTID